MVISSFFTSTVNNAMKAFLEYIYYLYIVAWLFFTFFRYYAMVSILWFALTLQTEVITGLKLSAFFYDSIYEKKNSKNSELSNIVSLTKW